MDSMKSEETELTTVESDAVSIILEECVDKLYIFKKILPSLSHIPFADALDQLLGLKSTDAESESPKVEKIKNQMVVLKENKPKMLDAISATEKVQEDRTFLDTVLSRTLEELKATHTFQNLVDAIQNEEKREEHLRRVTKESEDSLRSLQTLQEDVISAKREGQAVRQQLDDQIAKLKEELYQTKFYRHYEYEYAKEKISTDVQEITNKCQVQLDKTNKVLQDLHQKEENEMIVNSRIDAFLTNACFELETQAAYWTKKMREDKVKKEDDIAALKLEIINNESYIQDLIQKHSLYVSTIEEYREEERLKREAEEQQQREWDAALKIQAFWRATMVRKKLGPYKKKKRKGKKSGKKGGKKDGKKSGKKSGKVGGKKGLKKGTKKGTKKKK